MSFLEAQKVIDKDKNTKIFYFTNEDPNFKLGFQFMSGNWVYVITHRLERYENYPTDKTKIVYIYHAHKTKEINQGKDI